MSRVKYFCMGLEQEAECDIIAVDSNRGTEVREVKYCPRSEQDAKRHGHILIVSTNREGEPLSHCNLATSPGSVKESWESRDT